jgi:hypothetical protein
VSTATATRPASRAVCWGCGKPAPCNNRALALSGWHTRPTTATAPGRESRTYEMTEVNCPECFAAAGGWYTPPGEPAVALAAPLLPPHYGRVETARRLRTTTGTLRRSWVGVFTPLADAAGRTLYRQDEVDQAAQHLTRGSMIAAVLELRRATGRLQD